MREFLVRIDIDASGGDAAELDRLRAREGERAAELSRLGHLTALWRVDGRWANAGVWRAADAEALTALIDSLPLRPYMTVQVDALSAHPSDPRHPRETGRTVTLFELPELPPLHVAYRHTMDVTPGVTLRAAPQPHPLTPLPELSVQRREGSQHRVVSDRGEEPPVGDRPATSAVVSSGGARRVLTAEIDVLSLTRDIAHEARDATLLEAVSRAVQSWESSTPQADRRLDPHRVALTHSGAHGLRGSAEPAGENVTVDIGVITDVPAARKLADGSFGVQVRPVARLTITSPAHLAVEAGAQLVSYLTAQITRTAPAVTAASPSTTDQKAIA